MTAEPPPPPFLFPICTFLRDLHRLIFIIAPSPEGFHSFVSHLNLTCYLDIITCACQLDRWPLISAIHTTMCVRQIPRSTFYSSFKADEYRSSCHVMTSTRQLNVVMVLLDSALIFLLVFFKTLNGDQYLLSIPLWHYGL